MHLTDEALHHAALPCDGRPDATDTARPGGVDDSASSPGSVSGLIPAATFAALVGRSLRTLANWDRAGMTGPVMIRGRRYYRAADVAALLAHGDGRKGPREGSMIKYIGPSCDSGV